MMDRRALVVLCAIVAMFSLPACSYVPALYPAPRRDVLLGVTFSARYARELSLDPKATYAALMDDLGVRHIRLPVYWDEVEPSPGEYDFSSIEDYLAQAKARQVHVIVSLGYKQERWPECYEPPFVKNASVAEKRRLILDLLRTEILALRSFDNIDLWQIENEPFLPHGECGYGNVLSFDFVRQEIDLARTLDNRPLMVTDSGEWSLWTDAIQLGDVFGSTMYRSIWIPNVGLIVYPIPPLYYPVKNDVLRTLLQKKGSTTIVELQAEPWIMGDVLVTALAPEWLHELFPEQTLGRYVEYAETTGFPQIYLWGAEWWYWMQQKGYPQYVAAAKAIFRQAAAS